MKRSPLSVKKLLEAAGANSSAKDEPATVHQVATMIQTMFDVLRVAQPMDAPEWVRPADLPRLLGQRGSNGTALLDKVMAMGPVRVLPMPTRSKREGAKGNPLYHYGDIVAVLQGKKKGGAK